MKRTIHVGFAAAVFLAGGLFTAPDAAAQRGPQDNRGQRGPEQRIERHVEMLNNRLELSDDQEKEIRELLTAHAADARAWFEDNESATSEERRAQMRASWTDLQESYTAVLTPEQAEQMAELRERMQNRRERGDRAERGDQSDRGDRAERGDRSDRGDRAERGGERMRGRHMADSRMMEGNLLEKLELSDEQKEQVKSLHEERRAEMQEWREQNEERSREERRTQMRQRAEEHRAALLEILTEEQEQQLEELRSEWREQIKEHRESRGESDGN